MNVNVKTRKKGGKTRVTASVFATKIRLIVSKYLRLNLLRCSICLKPETKISHYLCLINLIELEKDSP